MTFTTNPRNVLHKHSFVLKTQMVNSNLDRLRRFSKRTPCANTKNVRCGAQVMHAMVPSPHPHLVSCQGIDWFSSGAELRSRVVQSPDFLTAAECPCSQFYELRCSGVHKSEASARSQPVSLNEFPRIYLSGSCHRGVIKTPRRLCMISFCLSNEKFAEKRHHICSICPEANGITEATMTFIVTLIFAVFHIRHLFVTQFAVDSFKKSTAAQEHREENTTTAGVAEIKLLFLRKGT